MDLLTPYLGLNDWSTKYQMDTLAAAAPGTHVIAAPAGAGKTRFAAELLLRAPSFVVVDHAASRVPEIRRLIAGNSPVMLLERFADTNRGWMYNLFGDPWIDGPPAGKTPSTVFKLNKKFWEQLFHDTIEAYAKESGAEAPAGYEEQMRRAWQAVDLLDDSKWNAGHLKMAAVELFHQPASSVSRLSAKAAARAIAARETWETGLVADAALDRDPSLCEQASIYRAAYAVREFETRGIQEYLLRSLPSLSQEELETLDGMLPHDALRDLSVAVALQLFGMLTDPAALYRISRRLADLGRNDEALDAARRARCERTLPSALIQEARLQPPSQEVAALTAQAVDIARKMTPEIFARALSHHGDSLSGVNQFAAACDAYRESLEVLAARFPNLPNHVIQLVSATLDDYKKSCGRSQRTPDQKLIGPMEQYFAR